MAETNKSQMLSEAEIIEAINQDSLISVSLGAGQPQKNVKMSTLASVAAGLFFKGTVSDANVKESCLCITSNSCLNTPNDMTNYGGLLVTWYFGNPAYAFQFLLERENGVGLWVRGKTDWWRAWKRLV